MNKQFLTDIFVGCTLLAVVFSVSVPADEVAKGQKVSTQDMTNPLPLPPTDIYRPSGSKGPKHRDLATFAWLEFIALNATRGSDRGLPGGSFADSGQNQEATLVWETYQHRSELFPYTDGTTNPPQPWNDPPLYQFYIEDSAGNKSPYETPANVTRFNNLDEATQIGQNTLFFPDLDGTDGEPDQVLFEAKVNQIQSNYVRTRVESGTTDPIDLEDNTIEVKSAWLPLTAIPEDQLYRYHIAEVTVYGGEDGTPEASVERRALIGLHIIQKTPNFPAFIFATFEHTDLLEGMKFPHSWGAARLCRGIFGWIGPFCGKLHENTAQPSHYGVPFFKNPKISIKDPFNGHATDVAYIPTYDEIAYTLADTTTLNGIAGMPVVDNPNIGFRPKRPIARPNGKRVRLPKGSVEDLPGAMDIGGGQVLVPVVQPPTTNKNVAKANKDALKAMKKIPGFDEDFVWQYYTLKGVQGVPTNNETANDFYLANIVIESSQPGIQLFRGGFTGGTTLTNARNQANVVDDMQGGQAFSVGGCQGCHGVAQTKAGFDFSFLFGAQDGKGFTPDTSGDKSQTVMLKRLDRYSPLLQPQP